MFSDAAGIDVSPPDDINGVHEFQARTETLIRTFRQCLCYRRQIGGRKPVENRHAGDVLEHQLLRRASRVREFAREQFVIHQCQAVLIGAVARRAVQHFRR